jgi:hypothetical protein
VRLGGAVTVGQLREALEIYGEDVEVRIVHQPSWPLQEVLGGIFDPSEGGRCAFDDGGCEYTEPAELHDPKSADFDHAFVAASEQVIFLVANGHPSEGSPYGDKAAWDQMERLS